MEQASRPQERSSFNKALAEELAHIARNRGEDSKSEQRKELASPSLDRLKAQAMEDGGLVLYHGGLPETASLEDIDLNRMGSQQNKRNRSYGGFYMSDESSLDWATGYAQERNGILHGFLIAPHARIGEITGRDIDRLSIEERAMLGRDYDLVRGKDLLGRSQYVLLNKDAVTDMGHDKLN